MKLVIITVFTILGLNSTGQKLDNCGIDNNSKINIDEAGFLNSYLKNERASFDFSGKRIAFITGSSGTKAGSKNAYFNVVRKGNSDNSRVATSLIIFTTTEKLQSKGYDGIIAYSVKVFVDNKKKEKIINNLKSVNN